MTTLDDIVDECPGENTESDRGRVRKVMLVPSQLLEQWLGEPADIFFFLRLRREKLFEWQSSVGNPVMTSVVLQGELPDVMEKVWEEALERKWVVGDIPPHYFEQDPFDPCVVNFEWEGPITVVDLPD